MPNFLLSLTQRKKGVYIPPFKKNNEELKANFARIDKGKNFDVNIEVSKPMSKIPHRMKEKSKFVPICHHCHIVGHIRPDCPKLRSTSKVRPPYRVLSSSKTTHVCYHCGISRHIHLSCFKLYPQKQVSKWL